MKGLLFLKPSLTLYRCPLHRPRALAARRAHLQLRAPASAAYTSPALRAVRSVPHARTVPRACRSPAARLARIARVHIRRAHIVRAVLRHHREPPTPARLRTARARIRPSPRRSFETAGFQFFAKQFKL